MVVPLCETMVTTYKFMWCHNPEDHNAHIFYYLLFFSWHFDKVNAINTVVFPIILSTNKAIKIGFV
jgi:hypothetical protein